MSSVACLVPAGEVLIELCRIEMTIVQVGAWIGLAVLIELCRIEMRTPSHLPPKRYVLIELCRIEIIVRQVHLLAINEF